MNIYRQGNGILVAPCDPPRVCTRWGDYASTVVDPVDGCTFYHTNMALNAGTWETYVVVWKVRYRVEDGREGRGACVSQ